MITKNSSGTNLSANYDSVVAVSPREWQVQIYCEGSLLSCGIKSLTITKGSCGNMESFSVGNVYSSMMTAELMELSTDIKGRDIEVRIGLNTGSMEWITIGKFTAIEVVKTAYSTSVTAYGFSTSKTAGAFVIPSTLSLGNIASAIQTASGLNVSFDSGITTTYQLAGSLVEGISCYQGLQILAHAIGGYAVDTYDGNIAIHRFSNTSTVSVATDRMKSLPNVEELAFSITGVQVTATGQYQYTLTTDVAIDPNKTYYTYDSVNQVYVEVTEPVVADIGTYYERSDVVYTYGNPLVLFDANENMSADVFNIYKGLVGYSYKTGVIDLSIGDPRIEGNDVLTVTDVNGNTYTVPCHMVTHRYDGGLSTTVQAVKSTSGSDGLVSNAPISQQIDQIGMVTAIARASAESAQASAESALASATAAYNYAEQAYQGLESVRQSAQEAKDSADQAKIDAGKANAYANSAIEQVGIIQDVVGVLDLLSTNADYQLTTDAEIVEGKWYFTRSGESPNYVYTVVTNPVADELGTYYEIVSIDQAVESYITSRLAVTSAGLWIQDPNMSTKILLSSTEGVVLYGPNGTIIGKYGSTAQIGNDEGFHIEMDGTELGFYQGPNTADKRYRVAYISNQQLYITKSVVLQQMDLGTPVSDGGLGQWSWKVHANSQNPSRNNLYLKWIG